MQPSIVLVGSDEIRVQVEGTQSSKYRAAEIFKEKYSLDNSLNEIVYWAIPTRLPAPKMSTELVLKILRGELQEVEEVPVSA